MEGRGWPFGVHEMTGGLDSKEPLEKAQVL